LHNAAYNFLGLSNYHYSKHEVTAQTLPRFIGELDDNCVGFSVTMPLKSEMFKYADTVDQVAEQTNAINTVVRLDNGQLACYNTDVYGIVKAIEVPKSNVSNANKVALIVGSGATARSAFVALQMVGVSKIYITSRQQPEWVKSALTTSATNGLASWIDLTHELPNILKVCSSQSSSRTGHLEHLHQLIPSRTSASAEFDIVVSTLPWQPARELLPKLFANYQRQLLECAFPKVLPQSIDGSIMLVHQAIRQIELMTGQTVPFEVLERALVSG
jgi:shikimate dehydrogenase